MDISILHTCSNKKSAKILGVNVAYTVWESEDKIERLTYQTFDIDFNGEKKHHIYYLIKKIEENMEGQFLFKFRECNQLYFNSKIKERN